MPRIDTYTARGRSAQVNVRDVSPDSFGAQTGESLYHFGQTVQAVSDHLQRQRDEIEIVDRAAYFDQQMAAKYQSVLKDESLRGETVEDTTINRLNALKQFAKEHDAGIGETTYQDTVDANGNAITKEVPPASTAVQLALRKHIISRAADHTIQMQADTLKEEANLQAQDLQRTVNDRVDMAVLQPWTEAENLGDMAVLLGRARGNQIIPPEVIDKMTAAAHDRFWRQVASTQPARIMQIQAEYLSRGKAPENMDQSKIMEYGNIAMGRMNLKDKQDQADIKELQDKNHARATAQAIRGELDRENIAKIIDRRGLDPDKAMGLIDLNDKIKEKQRAENFIDGLTADLETRLRVLKYHPETTPERVEKFRDFIFEHRKKDHISQRDFEHLMPIWEQVNERVNKPDETGQNAAVTHAHEFLLTDLAVTGPMGFDSLGNQVKANAVRDYYREVDRDPKANPMDIAERVAKRYKPTIEQRIKLGEMDQNKLDTAKMEGLAKRGAISKAALEEFKRAQQQKQFEKLADQGLSEYTPPEQNWFDTIWDKVTGGPGKSDAPKPESPKSGSQKPKMRK